MFHIIGQLIFGLIVGLICKAFASGQRADCKRRTRMVDNGFNRHCRCVYRLNDCQNALGW